MKIQFRKITLLFTAAVMSVSMALVSCDKENVANPTVKESTTVNSARTDVEEMPTDYVLMTLPAEWVSSTEYEGEYAEFIETEENVEYYLKADEEGKIVAFAFSPASFDQLNISQDYFTTTAGGQVLTSASTEKGLITCLGACKKAVPQVEGCKSGCWGSFVAAIIQAII